jgi:hypothetical protein
MTTDRDKAIALDGMELYHPRGVRAADIERDNAISATLDIDPVFVNYIGKAIRRDPRYIWTDQELERLGVLGLKWDTVTDEQIKALARRLADAAHGK